MQYPVQLSLAVDYGHNEDWLAMRRGKIIEQSVRLHSRVGIG